jgi:deazaflavin-dependent oxidoreductase (nitroreductase family)
MTHDRPRDQRDLRERIAVRFFRAVNPLTRRMIPAGVPTGAPNVLLLVPGRRTGIERTMPVTVLDFEGRTYVQATYGASGWGRNLQAAETVTVVHSGGRRSLVRPEEIPPGQAAAILQRALAPYHRSAPGRLPHRSRHDAAPASPARRGRRLAPGRYRPRQ